MNIVVFILTLMLMAPDGAVRTVVQTHSTASKCSEAGVDFLSETFEAAEEAGVRIAFVCEPKKVPGA